MGLLIERGVDIYNETNFQENLLTYAAKGVRDDFFYFEPFGTALHLAAYEGICNKL